MPASDLTFPRKFVWGVATAAPQIEGAAFTDGKAASVWDTFARKKGRVHNGDTLDIACDHYHRYKQDFALMADLGVKHYRLSLAWPRIYPHGTGAVNQKGVDFYHRLLDAMLAKGITPWVTMFHWDLPQTLEDQHGGWRGRATVDAFARYADTIVQQYGDRVKNWITLNEISCFTEHAYFRREKAPGLRVARQVVNQTHHHAILCHGHGVRAVREFGGRGARVGLTDNTAVNVPDTSSPADLKAARDAFVACNYRVLDAVYRGHYAPGYLKEAGKDRPVVAKGDFDLISLPTDFLGMNIYTASFVRAAARGNYEILRFPKNFPTADATWLQLVPQSLHWGPRLAAEIYGVKSIYITENGCGYNDAPPVNGEVLDLHRREYVRNCLRELHGAIQVGVPVDGYFLWSFMDNFEWADGYARRFGIVYTDFKTQKRTPKLSAKWYAQVMKHNRIV